MQWIDLSEHDAGLWLDADTRELVFICSAKSTDGGALWRHLVNADILHAAESPVEGLIVARAPAKREIAQRIRDVTKSPRRDVEREDIVLDLARPQVRTHLDVVPDVPAAALAEHRLDALRPGDPEVVDVLLPSDRAGKDAALDWLASIGVTTEPVTRPSKTIGLGGIVVGKESVALQISHSNAVWYTPDAVNALGAMLYFRRVGDASTLAQSMFDAVQRMPHPDMLARLAVAAGYVPAQPVGTQQEGEPASVDEANTAPADDEAGMGVDDDGEDAPEEPLDTESRNEEMDATTEEDGEPHPARRRRRQRGDAPERQDFGEYIPHARKEAYRGIFLGDVRGMTNDDVRDLAAAQSDRTIHKETIWPRPDPKAYQEAGKSYALYKLHETAWKTIGGKPKSDRFRIGPGRGRGRMPATLDETRQYVFAVASFRSFIESADSAEGLIQKIQGVFDRDDAERTARRQAAVRGTWSIPNTIEDALFAGQDVWATTPGEYQSDESLGVNSLTLGRRVTADRKRFADYSPFRLKRDLSTAFENTKDTPWEVYETRQADVKQARKANSAADDNDSQALVKAAADRYFGTDRKAPVQSDLEKQIASREGMPAWRTDGEPVSEDGFLEIFGLRGGQYGNWVRQDERGAFLNLSYDSLRDLADIVGIPTRGIGFNGDLGVAWGARGRGKAAAHYEPGLAVINLTKPSGAGSLAHEWAHALDHWAYRRMAVHGLGDNATKPFLTETRINFTEQAAVKNSSWIDHDLLRAFRDFMDAVQQDKVGDAEEPTETFIRYNVLPYGDFMERFFRRSKARIAWALGDARYLRSEFSELPSGNILRSKGMYARDDLLESIARNELYETLCKELARRDENGKVTAVHLTAERTNEIVDQVQDKFIQAVARAFDLPEDVQSMSFTQAMKSPDELRSDYRDPKRVLELLDDNKKNLAKNIKRYVEFMLRNRVDYHKQSDELGESVTHTFKTSKMYQESTGAASAHDRSYYGSSVELFARAYEACALQAMRDREAWNTYLVSDNKIDGRRFYPEASHVRYMMPRFKELNRAVAHAMKEDMGLGQDASESSNDNQQQQQRPAMRRAAAPH